MQKEIFKFSDSARTVTMNDRVGRIVTLPYSKVGIVAKDPSYTKRDKALIYLDYGITCQTCSDAAEDSGIPAVDCNCGAYRPKGEISWRVDY